jgi:predicted outer membrane protein
MNLTRRAALSMAPLGAALVLAGCQRTAATATAGSGVSQDNLDFISNAYNIITFDEETCRVAQTQARDPRVKALAQQLLDQATAFREKVKPIADSLGIMPPSVLRSDLRVRLAHQRLQHGLDFDQTFLEDEIASHTDALNSQEMMMTMQGGDPRLVEFSKQGTALLKANLEKLRSLQKSLMLGR